MGFFDSVGGKPYLVSAPNKRPFYLISFGGLHRRDLPVGVEARQKKLALLDSYKYRAAAVWMVKDSSRSEEDAETWINELPDNWFAYLNEVDRTEAQKVLLEIIGDTAQRPEAIATLMMRNRLAYHVEVTQDIVKGAEQISIVEPWFNGDRFLSEGDKLQTLNGSVVRVLEPYRNDGILKVAGLDRSLRKGEPLFLMNGGSFVIGDRAWTDEHTQELLLSVTGKGKSQSDQIIEFYKKEQFVEEVIKDDKKAPLAPEVKTSEPTPSDPAQTGMESTGDSFTLDVPIPDSTPQQPLILLQSA
jgi:hypothetical protein